MEKATNSHHSVRNDSLGSNGIDQDMFRMPLVCDRITRVASPMGCRQHGAHFSTERECLRHSGSAIELYSGRCKSAPAAQP
ncbi:MAG: hypothetical protein FWD02_04205 [Bacteroidales bacterium]|nr:hypothetical protein [Bacteroidales bacterium]